MPAVIFNLSFPEGIMQPKPYKPLPPIRKGDMLTTSQIHPDVLTTLSMRGAIRPVKIREPKPSPTAHLKMVDTHIKISKKGERKKTVTLDRWLR